MHLTFPVAATSRNLLWLLPLAMMGTVHTFRFADAQFETYEPALIGFPTLAIGTNDSGRLQMYARPYNYRFSVHNQRLDNGFYLLSMPEVRNQLELSDTQRQKFVGLFERLNESAAEFGELSYDDLTSRRAEIGAKAIQLIQRYESSVDKILLPHQLSLLKVRANRESDFARSFLDVITTDPVATKIQLSDKQKSSLRARHNEIWPRFEEKINAAHATYFLRLKSKMKIDQKEKLESLFGTDFSLEKVQSLSNLLGETDESWIGNATVQFSKREVARASDVVAKIVPTRPDVRNRFNGLINVANVRQQLEISDKQIQEFRAGTRKLEKALKARLAMQNHSLASEFERMTFEEQVRLDLEQQSGRIMHSILLPHQHKILSQWRNRCVAITNGVATVLFRAGIAKENGRELVLLDRKLRSEFTKAIEPEMAKYRAKLIRHLPAMQKQKLYELFGEKYFTMPTK